MKISLISLMLAISVTGCATWSTSNVDLQGATAVQTTTVAKTPVNAIVVSDADIVGRKYESLGDVTVNVNKTTVFHPNPTQELVNERLKEKAHELGADAVILVRYGQGGISLLSWGSLEGKGRAIRFVK